MTDCTLSLSGCRGQATITRIDLKIRELELSILLCCSSYRRRYSTLFRVIDSCECSKTLQHFRPKLTQEQVRTQLGGFGFSADKAQTAVGKLSGGERARLMLALTTLDKPNLLILDEPTNHLDIDARNELLTALNDFDGAVILVSHDRRLIEATAETLLLV